MVVHYLTHVLDKFSLLSSALRYNHDTTSFPLCHFSLFHFASYDVSLDDLICVKIVWLKWQGLVKLLDFLRRVVTWNDQIMVKGSSDQLGGRATGAVDEIFEQWPILLI